MKKESLMRSERLFIILLLIFAFVFGAGFFNHALTADDSSFKKLPPTAAPAPKPAPYSDDDSPYVKIVKLKDKLKETPNDADILIELGEIYLEIDNPIEAKSYFSTGLMKDPDGVDSNYRRSRIYYAYALSVKYQKDSITFFEEYCSKLNKLTNVKKNAKSNCFYYLGESYGTVDRYEKAIENYKKALVITPGDIYIIQSLGDAYYFTNKYELAIENYEIIIPFVSPQPYLVKAGMYDFSYYGLMLRLGYSYLTLGKRQQAMNAFKQITSLTDEQDKNRRRYIQGKYAYSYLASIYFDIGMHSEVVSLLQPCIDNGGGTHLGYYLMGREHLLNKNPSEAKKAFLKAIELWSDDAGTYFYLGNAYGDLNEYDKAIEAYNHVLARDKNNAASLLNIGVSYGRQGQSVRAADYYYRAGLIFLDNKNRDGALLALDNLKKTDSPLYDKLYKKIYKETSQKDTTSKKKKTKKNEQ